MEKLKTLKDIKKWASRDKLSQTVARKRVLELFYNKLREEAIKWVKDCNCSDTNIPKWQRCIACGQFIDFFNLTSEDLKDEQTKTKK